MVDKNNITDKYYHILELLDKSPGDEEALNALIELEEDIKSYLFDILKSKHANDFDKSNVYSKFGKGNKDRDWLESLIMNKTTGNSLSINDITDLFIKKINDILAMPINNQEKIKLLNIQYLQIKETILPPDYDKKPIIGSGNGWIEKGEDFDRFGLLIQILREQGVYTDDILAIEGINKTNMMRRNSYICLYIPRIDKTIFINNNYGEATFVYDGSMDIEWFTSLGKEGLKSDFKKITFSEKNIDLWKNEIINTLFHSGDKKEKTLGEKPDVRVIKNDIKKKYQKQEFLDFYERLSEEEKQKIYYRNKYEERSKKYPELPQSYRSLIRLLGGNNKCREGGYIKALIQGKGEEYLDSWKIRSNKTEEEKKQEFLDMYGKLTEEEKQKIYSLNKYKELAKQYPELPKSYQGFIILLGGHIGCAEGGYVKALIQGKGDEYFSKWNKTEEEKRKEFLDIYERLSEEEKQKIYFVGKYRKRAKQYPELPQSYMGLISLLGGNNKCQEGGYIKALIQGAGDEYFSKWNKTEEEKKEEKKQEFLEFYERLTEEERQNIYYRNKYEKRSKKYPELPQSYGSLIRLLGGNDKCRGGGYIKALIEGTGEEYFDNWEKLRM